MQAKKLHTKTILLVFLFLALQAIAGFGRDSFFVQINTILYMKFYPESDRVPISSLMQVFDHLSYQNLYYLKFPLTLLWTLLYYGLNYATIRAFAKSKPVLKGLTVLYILLVALATLSVAYGYLMYNTLEKDEYTLSRWLMGIAQSPLPALLLIASATLLKRDTDEQST